MARGVKALYDTHKTEFQFGSIANTLCKYRTVGTLNGNYIPTGKKC